MKKFLGLVCLAGLLAVAPGCAMLGINYSGSGPKFWTYNLKQSLARSGGDVAMTMVLDQGVDKKVAVGFCESVIALFQQDANITSAAFKEKICADAACNPALSGLADKAIALLPSDLVDTEAMPPEIKDAIVSFMRDGAIYGATMYKEGLRLKMVKRGKEKSE